MNKKITIVELAEMAGVSTATVSRVINNTGKVEKEKKEKILELIDRYDYRPNQIAKALQASRSNTVGFVVPHINSPYYARIFYETEIAAKKMGYTILLCNSESDKHLESNILNTFMSANVRAIVFMGGRLDDINIDKKYLDELEKINKKIPIIACVDVAELNCVQVYQEQKLSSKKLLEHLSIEGYKDVALLGGFGNIRTTAERRNEIIESAGKYGIKIRKKIIESDYSVEGGNIAMQQLLKCGKMPEAIICINDLVAIGALSETYKNNIKVPEDIAISGYDGLDISSFVYPGITTVACNFKEYAETIVNIINNIESVAKNTRKSISTELIIRGSTKIS